MDFLTYKEKEELKKLDDKTLQKMASSYLFKHDKDRLKCGYAIDILKAKGYRSYFPYYEWCK